jgi:hypothetical protein
LHKQCRGGDRLGRPAIESGPDHAAQGVAQGGSSDDQPEHQGAGQSIDGMIAHEEGEEQRQEAGEQTGSRCAPQGEEDPPGERVDPVPETSHRSFPRSCPQTCPQPSPQVRHTRLIGLFDVFLTQGGIDTSGQHDGKNGADNVDHERRPQ